MTYAETVTESYTVADIGKVIDCIAADLDMNSQSTGLLSRETVKSYAADVRLLAQRGYLREANIVLKNSAGVVIKAAKYEVSTDASILKAQRPGNNLWPQTPGGELSIVVQYSPKFAALTAAQRQALAVELDTTWSTSTTDLSFPSLTRAADRTYASGGWGVTKSIFS
jgi:Bacterial HORMA domain family 1